MFANRLPFTSCLELASSALAIPRSAMVKNGVGTGFTESTANHYTGVMSRCRIAPFRGNAGSAQSRLVAISATTTS